MLRYINCLLLIVGFSLSLKIRHCGKFPVTTYGRNFVYDGHTNVYMVGGSDRVVASYNLQDGRTELLGFLPRPIRDGGASLHNGDLYFFGGINTQTADSYDTIFKFNKDDPSPVKLEQHLLKTRFSFAAVSVEDTIYLIDGSGEKNFTVEAYIPNSGESRIVFSVLDINKYHEITAIHVGEHIYVLAYNYWKQLDLLRFNLNTSELERLNTTVPQDVMLGSVVAVGDLIYFGVAQTGPIDDPDLIVFDTKSETWGSIDFNMELNGKLVYVPKENRIYAFSTQSVDSELFKSDLYCIDLPPATFECNGRKDGLYPFPGDCSKYIVCSHEIKHEMNCPVGLHFNPELRRCDYPDQASCTEF